MEHKNQKPCNTKPDQTLGMISGFMEVNNFHGPKKGAVVEFQEYFYHKRLIYNTVFCLKSSFVTMTLYFRDNLFFF